MLCFVVLVALAAMATATQPMVISNGVVKVTVAADGLVSMLELVSPSAGVKPLALTLDHDGWEATVRPGGAPGPDLPPRSAPAAAISLRPDRYAAFSLRRMRFAAYAPPATHSPASPPHVQA